MNVVITTGSKISGWVFPSYEQTSDRLALSVITRVSRLLLSPNQDASSTIAPVRVLNPFANLKLTGRYGCLGNQLIYKMASTVRLLCLFLCCWYVDETLGTNPGLKIRLSQPGLNYAARVAVQKLSAKVRGASLPGQSGQAHTPVGKVDYEISNVKVGGL